MRYMGDLQADLLNVVDTNATDKLAEAMRALPESRLQIVSDALDETAFGQKQRLVRGAIFGGLGVIAGVVLGRKLFGKKGK